MSILILAYMSLKGEFDRWANSLSAPLAVKFVDEDDGVATLVFGGKVETTLRVSPIMDGESRMGYFVEADDESEEVETWMNEANEFLTDQGKLSFGQCIEKLIRGQPGTKSPGATPLENGEDDDIDFEGDDIAEVIRNDEDEAEMQERRAKYARELSEQQQEEAITASLSAGASHISKQAQTILMKEMRNLMKIRGDGDTKALDVEMINDRLDRWRATMHVDSFPACPLKEDLRQFASKTGRAPAIIMDLMFPNDFPQQPPFIRVIRPRFQMHTGHVTIGGSVCMQALTPSGWLPTFGLENIFVDIRSQIVEGGGRLDLVNVSDYTEAEAKEAFNRVAQRYGWNKAS